MQKPVSSPRARPVLVQARGTNDPSAVGPCCFPFRAERQRAEDSVDRSQSAASSEEEQPRLRTLFESRTEAFQELGRPLGWYSTPSAILTRCAPGR